MIRRASGEIIIFVDEMHMLMGAGKSGGSMDAIMQNPLARGGATTSQGPRTKWKKVSDDFGG